MIKTRFAPSPTGEMHLGSGRTALFEYLFARHGGGEFLLRIEDTDRTRHSEKALQSIKESLVWLGLIPDNLENPLIQSQRLEIYQKAALKLVKSGSAYVCNCSKERLEKIRKEQTARGEAPHYDGRCRQLEARSSKLEALPAGAVIRQKNPTSGITKFTDLIRGEVEFKNSELDDQVLLKSDGFPTYHLASIVDDHEMGITHVIRGEEWLPSTPKHLLLYQAFGWKAPHFAHLPVILGPNKGKLSKREGAVSILEYRRRGYLPEAVVNFLALLGWNPKTEEEFFTLKELEEKFDLAQVNKAPAAFNREKLDFFNRHYLQLASPKRLLPLLSAEIVKKLPKGKAEKAIELAKERMTTLNDFESCVGFLLKKPRLDTKKIVFKKSTQEKTKAALAESTKALSALSDWNAGKIKAALDQLVAGGKFSAGDVFWSVRYALTGEEKSPPPEQIAEILGRQEVVSRLQSASNHL